MSVIINGTDGVTFNDSSLQGAAASPFGLKNRIINGDMRIDQRNAGASITPTDASYNLDRWTTWLSQSSKITLQQNQGSVTPPAGFTNYLGITSSSAYTVGVSEVFAVRQHIEGYNIADLAWGTASAKTITLSFWVRSSLTGTFGGALANSDFSKTYPFSYTISAANTWEQKTVTVAGPTDGTWNTTNSQGITVIFSLGAGANLSGTAGAWSGNFYVSSTGATSVVGTNAATWRMTGVQLEVGTSATPFERRQYGQELALCQRYFYKSTNAVSGGSAYNVITLAGFNSTRCFGTFSLPVSLRASPTITFNGCAIRDGALSIQATVTNIFPVQTVTTVPFSASVPCEFNVASGLSSNVWYGLGFINTGNDFYALSAEL